MKKLKKSIVKNKNINLFKPDVKSSRVTIDSRVCNVDKFNEFFALIDNTKNYKNIISQYCYDNLLSLVSDYKPFLTHYKFLDNSQLNSWERQTIFQEIAGHYSETTTRYLDKAKFIVSKSKSNINNIALFINSQSNLIVNNKFYALDFNIDDKLIQLTTYLSKYNLELSHNKNLLDNKDNSTEDINKEISKLERLIKSYNKLIANYHEIKQFKINKPLIYNRLIQLIIDKKLRLISKVKLAIYQTGTHARHLDNAQLSIVKDLSNKDYQYFIKVRKVSTLSSREPKLNNKTKTKDNYQELLDKYNEDNFIYLPLIFNKSRLKSIGKSIDNVLIKDNPQILIKYEQLRNNSKSRKIHIIFNYEQQNNLAKVIENNLINKTNINPTELNTLGCDLNLKHNLIADSNGHTYSDILNSNNKNRFIDNLNEIVELFSIKTEERTVKQKYRYEKLLRSNESLLKTYLSGLIKDWKSKDILHLVFEDLNILNDKSYYEHKGIKIKYSRLSRLLRLGQIKHWVASMAEKQGIFTHFINPAYTSQECSVCHYISRNNRTKQEEFICRNPACANHKVKINADSNAAKIIKSRLLNKTIRNKLGKDNVYQCSRTKTINYKLVKNIVEDEYKIGVVTELLPNAKLAKSKEDGVRNHTEASLI